MHHQKTAIAEIPKHSDHNQHTERDLHATQSINLCEAHIDPVEMSCQILVLLGCDHLVRRPQKHEPRKPQPQNQQRHAIQPVLGSQSCLVVQCHRASPSCQTTSG